MSTLTQAQRNQIRYALEDAGIPEVLAFMAARNATNLDTKHTGRLSVLFLWSQSPEGHDFWQMAAATAEQTFSAGGAPIEFPNLNRGY